jgi:hypothetical protein
MSMHEDIDHEDVQAISSVKNFLDELDEDDVIVLEVVIKASF